MTLDYEIVVSDDFDLFISLIDEKVNEMINYHENSIVDVNHLAHLCTDKRFVAEIIVMLPLEYEVDDEGY